MTGPDRRRRYRGEAGQVSVEFVVLLPVLLLVLFAIIQFGKLYNNYVTLTDATRVGARVAAVSRCPTGSGCTCPGAYEARLRAAASSLTQGSLTVSYSPTPCTSWTLGGEVAVTATYPWSISILGLVVQSGTLTSTARERIE